MDNKEYLNEFKRMCELANDAQREKIRKLIDAYINDNNDNDVVVEIDDRILTDKEYEKEVKDHVRNLRKMYLIKKYGPFYESKTKGSRNTGN